MGLTFFAVCGGDYGLEDSVGAAGPLFTMIGLLVLPWLWSLPIALMTAELSAMIPESGGYVIWINRAFGPFAAHQNAIWNLVANAFDNALYPVMFVDYLQYFPALRLEGFARWLLAMTMLASVTCLNLSGVDVVASASALFALLVISPFAVLAVAGLPTFSFAPLFAGPSHPVRWGVFLSVLLWNTSGYDSVGALAAEVKDPGRTFPRAMISTIVLITLVYSVPLAVAISLDKEGTSHWTDGSFTIVASEHVGDWLSAWISLGGALSAAGLLNTLLCTAARVAASSARLHVLPAWLGVEDARSGVPRNATIVLSLLLAFACTLPFAELVSISMLFYGATTFFEFLSLLRLRVIEPHQLRPFKIPLNGIQLLLCLLPPAFLCLLLIALAPWEAWVAFAASFVVGSVTYLGRADRPSVRSCWRSGAPSKKVRRLTAWTTGGPCYSAAPLERRPSSGGFEIGDGTSAMPAAADSPAASYAPD